MKRKVLLMGASGSGKTSMRSLIFSNHQASLTARLGVTIDVEQNHVRFLGDLVLNLWDCGGQEAFMDSYLSTQRDTIFADVRVLIYVFEVDPGATADRDARYFRDCMDALRKYSPTAQVYLLVHKMDLVRDRKQEVFDRRKAEILQQCGGKEVTVYPTSIYDESLYKAWSQVVHSLIPHVDLLTQHLTTLARACGATEAILFERATFLLIAASESRATLEPTRHERTSELIKAFKHACSRARDDFASFEFELPDCTAVLDGLTRNLYVLVIVHDPTIETAAIKINIQLARAKFGEVQGESLV